jgi:hypothetical protein
LTELSGSEFLKNACFMQLVFSNPVSKGKGKAVPSQTWSGPEGSRKLRFPNFMETALDGGKVVCFMHRPPLPPGLLMHLIAIFKAI